MRNETNNLHDIFFFSWQITDFSVIGNFQITDFPLITGRVAPMHISLLKIPFNLRWTFAPISYGVFRGSLSPPLLFKEGYTSFFLGSEQTGAENFFNRHFFKN